MDNFGLLLNDPRHKDYRFGGVTSLPKDILVPSRDWYDFLPDFEWQIGKYFDSYGCVSWSALNAIETLLKKKYGLSINFSDRFTATVSGTVPGRGNYLYKVADSILTDGLVFEEEWPWSPTMKNVSEFYSTVPDTLRTAGRAIFDKFRFSYEFVYPSNYLDALQMAPLQVIMKAYGLEKNGIFQRTEDAPNHAVLLYGVQEGDFWNVYDHYDRKFKRLAWDYNLPVAIRWNAEKIERINPITPTPMQLPNNTLVQLVEGPGGFGLHLDGKIIMDDLAKILASFVVRNNGDVKDKTVPLTLALWNEFEKVNLKGEKV